MPLPQEEYSPFLEGMGNRPSASVFRPPDVPVVQGRPIFVRGHGEVLKKNDDAFEMYDLVV